MPESAKPVLFEKEIISDYMYRERPGRQTIHTSVDSGHGRLEERKCMVVGYGKTMQSMFKDKFEGLKSRVAILSSRTIISTGETSEETRYYVTSLGNEDPEKINNAIRKHWGIEHNLHWQLDFIFREDESRKVKNAARNFSTITKIALSILKKDKSIKGSLNQKRMKAGRDEN